MCQSKELEISPTKVYCFPPEIKEIKYGGKWIIVSVRQANWIVLENEMQLKFFHLLQHYNLQYALERYNGTEDDAQWVIIQLEARQFERTDVKLKQRSSSVHLYLTNNCNMRCPHCYMFAGVKKEDELMPDEIKEVIRGLAKNGINSIVLSGGEPLTNPNFEEFVLLASSLGLEVEVLSNGTLWTDEMVERLSTSLSSVQISIDGFDEDSNSIIRGKGNFDKALHTVDTLLENGIKVSVAMVPKWSNHLSNDADKYVAFAKNLIKQHERQPFNFNIVGEVWDGRDYRLSDEYRMEFKEIVSEIFTQIFGDDSEDASFIEYHRQFGIEENCAYGNLSISANGDVYLCAQIQPLCPIGNVRTKSIGELLKLSEEAKQKSEISNLKPCGECAIRYICGGDCRIKHFTLLDKGIIPSEYETPERICTEDYRNSMYELMVRTNESIFQ